MNHSRSYTWRNRTQWNQDWGQRTLVIVQSLSHVRFFAIPWTVAHQAPLSMGFFRQEYWNGLPFPSPGDLSDPGIQPGSPALHADFLLSEPPGKPITIATTQKGSGTSTHPRHLPATATPVTMTIPESNAFQNITCMGITSIFLKCRFLFCESEMGPQILYF